MTLAMMGVKPFFKVAIGYFLCKLFIQFLAHLLLAALSPCYLISAVVCNLAICSLPACGWYSSAALLLAQLIVPFAVQKGYFHIVHLLVLGLAPKQLVFQWNTL